MNANKEVRNPKESSHRRVLIIEFFCLTASVFLCFLLIINPVINCICFLAIKRGACSSLNMSIVTSCHHHEHPLFVEMISLIHSYRTSNAKEVPMNCFLKIRSTQLGIQKKEKSYRSCALFSWQMTFSLLKSVN